MSVAESPTTEGSPRFFAAEPKVALLHELKQTGYRFVTPSIATCRRVVRRPGMGEAQTLRDIFGWNLPFGADRLSPRMLDLMRRADLVRGDAGRLRSAVRVSSLGDDLLMHSPFPDNAVDAVFFGPDTYRFAGFLREELRVAPARGFVVDIGAGSGAGAITAARCGDPSRLVLLDVNTRALALARANLAAADLDGEAIQSDGLAGLEGRADLIVANPPFIAGVGGQTYKDGGDLHGCRLSLEWAVAAVDKLNPGGRLLLYTGSAIVDGRDPFSEALHARVAANAAHIAYRELDPDIFGSLLSSDLYADAERIAAVGLTLTKV